MQRQSLDHRYPVPYNHLRFPLNDLLGEAQSRDLRAAFYLYIPVHTTTLYSPQPLARYYSPTNSPQTWTGPLSQLPSHLVDH